LTDEQLLDIIDIVKETQIAGVIATNTTISREGLKSDNKLKWAVCQVNLDTAYSARGSD
jgi:dihydroorotate dehydrogenase